MIDPISLIVLLVAALVTAGVLAFRWSTRRSLPAPTSREALPPSPHAEDEPPRPSRKPPPSREPIETTAEPIRTPVALPRDKPESTRLAPTTRRPLDKDVYRDGLSKTRGGFVARLARLLRGKPRVDAKLRDEIEEVLFTADIGGPTAQKLLDQVGEVLQAGQIADAEAVWGVIGRASYEILVRSESTLRAAEAQHPYVLLAIGVNGVGKTTTLGKLAASHVRAGRRVLLVAGDTFRAAAVEQLEVWARRVGCDFHQGQPKADPSSVIFEGISKGRRENYDAILCDTAGRLHTRKELMDELGKVGRAASKANGGAPHDTYLVLDATIGQNALVQAQLFKETMDFTGLVVTKLDGTAKGGVVLGICDELGIPIRYIGIGEGVDDLRPFDAKAFVDALFADRDRVDSA